MLLFFDVVVADNICDVFYLKAIIFLLLVMTLLMLFFGVVDGANCDDFFHSSWCYTVVYGSC